MITMILLPIVALYVALLIWAIRKLKTWAGRSAVLLLLLSPVIYMVGSYQYVHYRHDQDCSREGGLKVFIQPEGSDRVRLDADHYDESYARGLLRRHSMSLVLVEAWDGHYNGQGQKTGYFAYVLDPATLALPNKDWKFIKTPIAPPNSDLYVISESARIESNLDTTTWKLSRNGRVFATWTMLYHYWSKNGAVNIGWQCFGPSSSDWKKSGPIDTLTALLFK